MVRILICSVLLYALAQACPASSGWTVASVAPQSSKAVAAAEEQAKKLIARRSGRYRAKGHFDLSSGFGDDFRPLPITGSCAMETLFEGRLALERSMRRFPGAPRPVENWSLFAFRPGGEVCWSVSCDSSRTPFLYLDGVAVDGELRMGDPSKKVYSLMTFGDEGRWSSKFGLQGSKRPMFVLEMSPLDMETPVELVAELKRAPLVPEHLNQKADDKDAANNWREEHGLLAKLAGDYASRNKKVRVWARVVAQGRFLIWLTESDGLLEEVAITGFDGPLEKYAHWRVAASAMVPHLFTGTFEKERLVFDSFGSSGKISLDLRKEGRIKIARRGTGGKGRVELVREALPK